MVQLVQINAGTLTTLASIGSPATSNVGTYPAGGKSRHAICLKVDPRLLTASAVVDGIPVFAGTAINAAVATTGLPGIGSLNAAAPTSRTSE